MYSSLSLNSELETSSKKFTFGFMFIPEVPATGASAAFLPRISSCKDLIVSVSEDIVLLLLRKHMFCSSYFKFQRTMEHWRLRLSIWHNYLCCIHPRWSTMGYPSVCHDMRVLKPRQWLHGVPSQHKGKFIFRICHKIYKIVFRNVAYFRCHRVQGTYCAHVANDNTVRNDLLICPYWTRCSLRFRHNRMIQQVVFQHI